MSFFGTSDNSKTLWMLVAFMAGGLLLAGVNTWLSAQAAQERAYIKAHTLADIAAGLPADSLKDAQTLWAGQLNDPQFAYLEFRNGSGASTGQLIRPETLSLMPPPNLGADGMLQSQVRQYNNLQLLELVGPRQVSPTADPQSPAGQFRLAFVLPELSESVFAFSNLALLATLFTVLCLYLLLSQVQNASGSLLRDSLKLLADGKTPDVTGNTETDVLLTRVQDRLDNAESQSLKLVTEEKFLTYRAARYEGILQTLPDGIIILDEDFNVVFLNQHIEANFRVSRSEVQASPLESWCTQQPLLEFVARLRASPHQVSEEGLTMPWPNAPSRSLGISAHPLYLTRSPRSSDGNSGFLLLFRDITQEVAAKQSRAEFVGSVSHEVKAPLNTIGLYAQMLEDNGEDPEFIIEAHNTIIQEVDRMTRLINTLLSMTQIEIGTFEPDRQRTHLKEVISECVDMLGHGDDRQRIQVIGEENIPPVTVDKELMRVAISNLMTNALKYSPAEKPVLVELEETPEAISVAVTDQGEGISPEEQARIFEKFYRSNNEVTASASGHGLGLAITQEIIRLHHGTITLESNPGEGSKFTIELWKRTGIAKHAI